MHPPSALKARIVGEHPTVRGFGESAALRQLLAEMNALGRSIGPELPNGTVSARENCVSVRCSSSERFQMKDVPPASVEHVIEMRAAVEQRAAQPRMKVFRTGAFRAHEVQAQRRQALGVALWLLALPLLVLASSLGLLTGMWSAMVGWIWTAVCWLVVSALGRRSERRELNPPSLVEPPAALPETTTAAKEVIDHTSPAVGVAGSGASVAISIGQNDA